MKILIIGLGEFGYSLLKHISEVSNQAIKEIRAFDIREDLIASLIKNQIHPDFPRYPLSNNKIKFYTNLKEAVLDIDLIILSINSKYIIDTIEKIQPYLKEKIRILNTSKALTREGKFFSEVIKISLSGINLEYAVLSGSTKASDILDQKRVIATIGATNLNFLNDIQSIFKSDNFIIKITNDVIAVEIAGIIKNILSILYGYMKTKNYSISEIYYILAKYKLFIEEIYPSIINENLLPAWEVDLYMGFELGTRNYILGTMLGEGKNIQEILLAKENQTLEGLISLYSLDKNTFLSKVPEYLLLQNLLINKTITDNEFKDKIINNSLLQKSDTTIYNK